MFQLLFDESCSHIFSFPATLLYTAAATDADSSQTFTYAFTAASTVMTIDPNNGKVSLLSALDYESGTSHTVQITATDSGTKHPTNFFIALLAKEGVMFH